MTLAGAIIAGAALGVAGAAPFLVTLARQGGRGAARTDAREGEREAKRTDAGDDGRGATRVGAGGPSSGVAPGLAALMVSFALMTLGLAAAWLLAPDELAALAASAVLTLLTCVLTAAIRS